MVIKSTSKAAPALCNMAMNNGQEKNTVDTPVKNCTNIAIIILFPKLANIGFFLA